MRQEKILIEIVDVGDRVRVTMTPPASDLLLAAANAHELTNAQAYAIFIANTLREKSRELASGLITLPRLG